VNALPPSDLPSTISVTNARSASTQPPFASPSATASRHAQRTVSTVLIIILLLNSRFSLLAVVHSRRGFANTSSDGYWISLQARFLLSPVRSTPRTRKCERLLAERAIPNNEVIMKLGSTHAA